MKERVLHAPLSVPIFQFSKDLKFAQNGIITESVIEPFSSNLLEFTADGLNLLSDNALMSSTK